MFVTTAEFLLQHHQQREHVLQIITAAEARGQDSLAEMNRQVLASLDRVIAGLRDDDGHGQARDAGWQLPPPPRSSTPPPRGRPPAHDCCTAPHRRHRGPHELRHSGQAGQGVPVLALHPARHPRRDRAAQGAPQPGTRPVPERQRISDTSPCSRLAKRTRACANCRLSTSACGRPSPKRWEPTAISRTGEAPATRRSGNKLPSRSDPAADTRQQHCPRQKRPGQIHDHRGCSS